MSSDRRKSDVEIAVLTEKVDTLAKHLLRHMEDEEEERRHIWKELTKLDKKLVVFFMLIFGSAGGPNIYEIGSKLIM